MAIVDALGVEVQQDVEYGRGSGHELLCDIYRPSPAQTKRTAVLHLHGGGFRAGSKAGARLARPLAGLGYTCISASYRVLPEATWPAQIHDVKAAIRWTRANASGLEFDADKLVILGYSAGARLALIAAGTQDDPALEGDGGNAGVSTAVGACIAFYAPLVASHPVLGDNPSAELSRSFDALRHMRADYPPTILLHGTADSMVPVDDSLRIYTALRQANVPVELHVVEGMTHIFDAHADIAQASATWIDLFVDRHVVNPRVYPSTEPPLR